MRNNWALALSFVLAFVGTIWMVRIIWLLRHATPQKPERNTEGEQDTRDS